MSQHYDVTRALRRGTTDKQRRQERMKYPLKHLVRLRVQSIMAISSLLVVMAILFAAITFTLDTKSTEKYVAAAGGLAWSLGEVLFCWFRRHMGLNHPTTKIWGLFCVNVIFTLVGLGEVVLLALTLSPVNLRIGVPFFGFAIVVTILEFISVVALVQNRQYREGKTNISDSSIKSTSILNLRLLASIVLHAAAVVPAYFYWDQSDSLSSYLPFMTFVYIGIVIFIDLFGFYASKQESELPSLLLYFTISCTCGFFGGFLLLMICADTSSFEVGFHPLLWSLSLFGIGVTGWLLQFGCTHRAWMLIKYKIQLRKNLDVTYSKRNIQQDLDDDPDSTDMTTSDYFETIFSGHQNSLPLIGPYEGSNSSEEEYEQ